MICQFTKQSTLLIFLTAHQFGDSPINRHSITTRESEFMDGALYRVVKNNMSMLRQEASKHSVIGVVIAVSAIAVASVISGYSLTGEVSFDAAFTAQKTNVVLWFLNTMPFIFALWGQYVSTMIASEASVLVMEQTHELRKQSELLQQKAAYDATHDVLTGLPNRVLFLDRLKQSIRSGKRDNLGISVLILDIDRFKEVNDTLGHHYGDVLLKQVGLRLTGAIRESDTLSRIGGDEFGIILPKLSKRRDAENVSRKIIRSLSSPFNLEKLSLEIQVSIGIASFPEHGRDADTLIQKADVAMYMSKQNNSDYIVYSPDIEKNNPRKLTLMGELRRAILENELTLHYQPKIKSSNSELHSVEALVRWNHPTHGLMPPNEFIPLAERTGLIDDLTIWVLRNSLEQCSAWKHAGFTTSMAVNLSSICLLNPDFPDILIGLLSSYNVPPQLLIMEITETSIITDPERALSILNRINQLGVRLSIDDFGTGYSSLAYLKKLPVSELKIDKSFVTDLNDNPSDYTIVNATIQLGHNLGLKVVAEGVENLEIFNQLKVMGCDYQQGFFISRPMPPDEFLTAFQDNKIQNIVSSQPKKFSEKAYNNLSRYDLAS